MFWIDVVAKAVDKTVCLCPALNGGDRKENYLAGQTYQGSTEEDDNPLHQDVPIQCPRQQKRYCKSANLP